MGAIPPEDEQEISYSEKYSDDTHEYRHVTLPSKIAASLPQRLLTEDEWRGLGVCQSLGWVHYMIHKPEPHILLFRRPLGTDPRTGKVIPKSSHKMSLRSRTSDENDGRHENAQSFGSQLEM